MTARVMPGLRASIHDMFRTQSRANANIRLVNWRGRCSPKAEAVDSNSTGCTIFRRFSGGSSAENKVCPSYVRATPVCSASVLPSPTHPGRLA